MSIKYLRSYLNCLEQMPLDVQRHVSQYATLDADFDELFAEIEKSISILREDGDEMPIAERVPQLEKFKGILEKLEALQSGKSEAASSIQDLLTSSIDELDKEERSYTSGDYLSSEQPPVQHSQASAASASAYQMSSGAAAASGHHERDESTPAQAHHQPATAPSRGSSGGATGEPGVKRENSSGGGGSGSGGSSSAAAKRPSSAAVNSSGAGDEPKKPAKKKGKPTEEHSTPAPTAAAVPAATAAVAATPAQHKYCFPGCTSTQESMVGCDNEQCKGGEWFHYECVGLKATPTSKSWYCPLCKPLFVKKK